jgi:glucokinase
MSASAEIVLLGDIGATNARFAIVTDGVLGPVTWIEVARYNQIGDAIGYLLGATFREMPASSALLAVAGPVALERCNFTNCAWTIDGRELRNQFNFKSVRIINDFEATALSLPHLMEQDVRSLGGGRRPVSGAPMAVLGPVAIPRKMARLAGQPPVRAGWGVGTRPHLVV